MKRVILALDEIQDLLDALNLVRKIGGRVYAVKIHNMYDKYGPSIVNKLLEAGATKVWNDVKLYDIPNTGKLRAKSITADIITVHATAGVKMMKEAVASGKEVFAVTVLTSFTEEEVKHIYNRTIAEQVLVLAKLAKEAGVKNIVCSPQEVKMLSTHPDLEGMNFVVPGIRSVGTEQNDQNRVGTPAEAILNGATYLVIGRQITKAEDPVAALDAVEEEIQNGALKNQAERV